MMWVLCDMQCINLKREILGIHFSYNKKFDCENNSEGHIASIKNISKSWKMRDLSIEGKITFKTLAISKIAHRDLITSVPSFIIKELNTIKKLYLAKKKSQNKKLYLMKYLRITWS